jgi:predicted phage-related endonuclease
MYKTQVAWYAAICDVPKVEVAVLIGNRDFRIYTYKRNKTFEDSLIKIACNFWNSHVIPRIPPPASSNSDCSILYPKSQRDAITANSDIADKIWLLKIAKEQEKKIATEIESLTVDIKNFMQDHDTLVDQDGNYLVTWKSNAPKQQLDIKKLQQESPEVFAKYTSTVPGCRMFLLK